MAVAPRLVYRLTEGAERPPLGPEVWRGTWLLLPPELASREYRDLYTGARVTVGEWEGKAAVPLEAVLARFPVALLHGADKS
jgi:maltooligosyltrehalose synthase